VTVDEKAGSKQRKERMGKLSEEGSDAGHRTSDFRGGEGVVALNVSRKRGKGAFIHV